MRPLIWEELLWCLVEDELLLMGHHCNQRNASNHLCAMFQINLKLKIAEYSTKCLADLIHVYPSFFGIADIEIVIPSVALAVFLPGPPITAAIWDWWAYCSTVSIWMLRCPRLRGLPHCRCAVIFQATGLHQRRWRSACYTMLCTYFRMGTLIDHT